MACLDPFELVFAPVFALLPSLVLNLVAGIVGVSLYRLAFVLTDEFAAPRATGGDAPRSNLSS